MTHLFEKLTKAFTTWWNSCELTVIRIGALMSINSCFTNCANVILACLQTGYRFQPLQPSISEKTVVGILCPSTLSCETKNFFNRPPIWMAFYSNRLRAQTARTFVSVLKASILFFSPSALSYFSFLLTFYFYFSSFLVCWKRDKGNFRTFSQTIRSSSKRLFFPPLTYIFHRVQPSNGRLP